MGFLKLPKGKGDVVAADVAQEAFNFIYERVPVEGAVQGDRWFEIAHFEHLATAAHLNLEDLSFYLLAYLADESSKTIYKISEKRFVAWMTSLATALPRNAAPPTQANGYAPLFDAAYAAIVDANTRIRANEEARVKFYHFLYHWCLKGNNGTDRVDIAKELWSCFFSASPVSFSKEEAKVKFTAYVCFPRINQWLDFITALAEKAKASKQSSSASDQMGISFDTWSQLIPFSKLENYKDYDDTDAWPVAMDDFVEYVQLLEKGKKA